MNKEEIEEYIREDLGCEPRHNCAALADAAREVALNCDCSPWDILKLVLENKPIDSLYTHSYGFHTREGRGIINNFQSIYYEQT